MSRRRRFSPCKAARMALPAQNVTTKGIGEGANPSDLTPPSSYWLTHRTFLLVFGGL